MLMLIEKLPALLHSVSQRTCSILDVWPAQADYFLHKLSVILSIECGFLYYILL